MGEGNSFSLFVSSHPSPRFFPRSLGPFLGGGEVPPPPGQDGDTCTPGQGRMGYPPPSQLGQHSRANTCYARAVCLLRSRRTVLLFTIAIFPGFLVVSVGGIGAIVRFFPTYLLNSGIYDDEMVRKIGCNDSALSPTTICSFSATCSTSPKSILEGLLRLQRPECKNWDSNFVMYCII